MLDGTSPYYGEPLSPPQVERVVSGTTTTRLERALLLIQQAVRLRLRRRRPPLAWLELEAERPPDEGACAACCPSGRALPPRLQQRRRRQRLFCCRVCVPLLVLLLAWTAWCTACVVDAYHGMSCGGESGSP